MFKVVRNNLIGGADYSTWLYQNNKIVGIVCGSNVEIDLWKTEAVADMINRMIEGANQ